MAKRASDRLPGRAVALSVVVLLTLCHGVVSASIQVFAILLEPIKASLRITDVQISLLQGFAFGVCAAVVAVPVARIADRGHRRAAAVTGAALWSLGTLLCAAAGDFATMFAGRALIGIGELCFLPAAVSLLTTVLPPDRRAGALGVFISGSSIGNGLAWFGGGWLLTHWSALASRWGLSPELQPWRVGFLIYAVVGAVLAALLLLLPEPPIPDAPARPDLRREWKHARDLLAGSGRSVWGVLLAVLCVGFGSVAAYMWLPTVFVRRLGLPYDRVGALLGVSFLIFCTGGAWLAGLVATRLRSAERPDAPLLVLCGAAVACSAALFLIAAAHTLGPASVGLAIALAASTMTGVMAPLALTEVAPVAIRSQVLSWQYVLTYLLPVGFGPTSVALLNRRIFADDRQIGWSVAIIYLVCGALCLAVVAWCRRDYMSRAGQLRQQDQDLSRGVA